MQPPIAPAHNGAQSTVAPISPSLQSVLIKLAQAQHNLETTQATASGLIIQPAVARYLALTESRKQLKQTRQHAYLDVVAEALTEFDGEQKAIHPDVTIGIFREAHISHHDVALLWLLCHAADTVNILNTKNMTQSIQSLGKVMPLVLRREHALSLIEAIFSADGFAVSGTIERLDPQTRQPIGTEQIALTLRDCTNSAAAREEAANHIQADLSPAAAWRWKSAPTVTPTTIPLKSITFATPITTPKPRIKRDLSHLIGQDTRA